MSLKRIAVGMLITVSIFVTHAVAQKNELSGILGRTFTSNQNIQGAPSYDPDLRFGDGLTFEINYARYLKGSELLSLSAEVPFVMNPDEDLHAAQNVVPKQYSSYFVTPAARVNIFPGQAVSPWVSLGGGLGHFSPSSRLEFGDVINPTKSGTNTGVLEIGLGLDVKVYKHFGLRGEARDFWSGTPHLNVQAENSRQANLYVGGGVVWHF